MINRINKIISFKKSIDTKCLFGLIYIYIIMPFFLILLPFYALTYRRYVDFIRKIYIKKRFKCWELKKKDIIKTCNNGYKLNIDDFGLNVANLEEIKKIIKDKKELIIGEIDQDGLIYSYYGTINGVEAVSKEEFFKKTQFKLNLMVFDNTIAVRKMFEGNRIAFLNELDALCNLNLSKCNVPAILDVDFTNLSIVLSFIPGLNLEQKLVQKGALLRDNDIRKNIRLMSLKTQDRCDWYVEEGRRVLSKAVDSKLIEDLFIEIKKIHRAGFEIYDIKYDKIIIEKNTKKIFIIDFDSASNYGGASKEIFSVMRDRDIEKFNLYFKTEKLTYKRIKKIIKNKSIPYFDKLYSPVYFGYGLHMGKILDVNVGYGRWHFLLKNSFPDFKGKRILSLGVNNSFNEIQLLRNGAREAIGVEIDENYMAQGKFVKDVFEWGDNELYNFRYINNNMSELPNMNLGKFDMVMSLCSLYYLEGDAMHDIVRYISSITDIFILQCNERRNIGRSDSDMYKRASVEYSVNMLKDCGFRNLKIAAPREYSRPLIIAKK